MSTILLVFLEKKSILIDMSNRVKQIAIDDRLYNDISSYCKLNNLKICDYVNDLLKKSFINDKFGDAPFLHKDEVAPVAIIKPKKVYVQPISMVNITKVEEEQQKTVADTTIKKSTKRKLK